MLEKIILEKIIAVISLYRIQNDEKSLLKFASDWPIKKTWQDERYRIVVSTTSIVREEATVSS